MRLFGSILMLGLAGVASASGRELAVKTALVVRARPTRSAAIVDRVAEGKRVAYLGRSSDGQWLHVRDGRREGWAPAAMIEAPDEPAPAPAARSGEESLAPPRAEAWVARSQYRDGGARLSSPDRAAGSAGR
jgi:hypothetical protein